MPKDTAEGGREKIFPFLPRQDGESYMGAITRWRCHARECEHVLTAQDIAIQACDLAEEILDFLMAAHERNEVLVRKVDALKQEIEEMDAK